MISRYMQAYMMNKDLDMYYAKNDSAALVRTMNLNEELGQVSHVFSDKTGTLTCNIMDFRKASINSVSYGQGITEIGRAAWKLQNKKIAQSVLDGEAKAQARRKPHVSFYCPKYERDVFNNGPQKAKINEFFRVLSVCHDVIPEKINGKVVLSASNPDDEALVCAAEYFGYAFVDRRENAAVVKKGDVEETIEILGMIAFSSKRKRMSVIVRDTDKKVKIFTKGADNVMLERMRSGQDRIITQTEDDMRTYAIEGLRCLMIALKEIPEQEYKD
jgi:phospholipid-transporting ATPase